MSGDAIESVSASATAANGLRDVSKLAVIVAAILYGIGVVLVNIDLGRHGVVNLELARPEYILAGALWASLVTVSLWVVTTMRERFLRASSIRERVKTAAGGILSAYATPWILLNVVTRYPKDAPWWFMFFGPVVLVGTATLINLSWETIEKYSAERPQSLRKMLSWGRPLNLLNFVPVFFLLLTAYATVVFPYIAREFGGGKKPIVHLFLSELPALPWEQLRIAVSKEAKRVGPAILLLQTNDSLVLRPVDGEYSLVRKATPAAAIDRKLLLGVAFDLDAGK